MVVIDKERCNGCGACIAECIAQNIDIEAGKAVVRRQCMECGHCFAACLQNAVTLPDYPQDGIVEVGEAVADAQGLLNLIKMRRSVRQYEKRPVEKEVIEQILQAGRFTATANNAQNVSYTVVQESLPTAKGYIWEGFANMIEAFKKIAGEEGRVRKFRSFYERSMADKSFDALFFDAPVLLIVTSPSRLSGSLAASTIELMAQASGLGVLFSGFIERSIGHSEEAQTFLQVDAAQICACMLLGYPDVTYQRSVPRKQLDVQWK